MSFFWFISLQLFRISVCNSDRNRCRFCAFRIATWTVKCCDSLRRVSRSWLRPGAPEKRWFGVLENASKHTNTYCMHIAHMTIYDSFSNCIFCEMPSSRLRSECFLHLSFKGKCLGCTRRFWLSCARGLCLGCARGPVRYHPHPTPPFCLKYPQVCLAPDDLYVIIPTPPHPTLWSYLYSSLSCSWPVRYHPHPTPPHPTPPL